MLSSSARLLSKPAAPTTRAILAIDYGRRRIGLALSDSLRITARPLDTWTRTNRRRDLARLREICRRHDVGEIVVGWPLRLDGTAGEMAEEASRFAERLRKHIGLRVELADERLSSWEARGTLEGTESRPKARRKRDLDEVAAAVILRDYLARAGNQTPGSRESMRNP
jgi:putative Holliday junction resolvase